MKSRKLRFVQRAMCLAVGAAVAMTAGCKSGAGGADAGNDTRANAVSGAEASKFRPTSASICLQKMIKNPPAPFHLDFARRSARDTSRVEANVTAATVDYTKSETTAGQSSSTTKHLERAQVTGMTVDFDLMGPVPWHGELVAAQDAAKLAGVESVNGYNTMKYSIDTANEQEAQKTTFESLMAVKDYRIVGTAWVTSDGGCLVKYAIDFEQDRKDGSVKKTHYKGNVTRR